MSKYEKEIDYIVEQIETNRGSVVAIVAKNIDEAESKSIDQIIEEAPPDLDRKIINDMFSHLVEIGRIKRLYYDSDFMILGSSDPIKNELIEYSEYLSE